MYASGFYTLFVLHILLVPLFFFRLVSLWGSSSWSSSACSCSTAATSSSSRQRPYVSSAGTCWRSWWTSYHLGPGSCLRSEPHAVSVPSSLRGHVGLGVSRCLQILLWKVRPVVQFDLLHGITHRSHGGLLGPDVQLPVQHGTVYLQ